ncbi:MAG TPA: efflux RND transporter periplasmic adaptor subunit [Anaerolineae bacterium]|nr:efflux RND transporter periplasmic adaptor subunit [Anaerolineae bacterium]
MHPNPRRIIPIVLLLALVGGGLWWLFVGRVQAQPSGLSASGTVEAVEITIAPELAGRVAEVLVVEGDRVTAGQALIQFDDTLLQTQLKQAEAALAAGQAQHTAAQANFDLLQAGAQSEQIASAQEAVHAAEAAVSGAQAQLAQLQAGPRVADIAAAEAAVAAAAAQRKQALDTHDKTMQCVTVTLPNGIQQEVCPGLGTREEQARAALEAAEGAYAAAVERLDQLHAGATRDELNAARARVEAAQAQQAMAQAQLDLLKSGARSEQLRAAQAQVDAAQAQVEAASAALDVLKVQLAKLTLTAPAAGVILTRAIEPGEVALPGAALLTLSQVDDLRVTVFVPEDRYGAIDLGEAVTITADSFPDETFAATVTHIADRAEFTPRNVQTAEGRRTTVFAVRLSVQKAEGKLKPGMPVDVKFD